MAAVASPPPSVGMETKKSNEPQVEKVGDAIASFRPTRCFRPESSKTSVTSLDFDDSGELALVARDDETLQLYNCKEGKFAKELHSKKYGVHLGRFTHHSQSIIYASTKVDDGIRYLSTHDNSYIRYFKGHKDTVTCLSLSPSNDTFASCSLDNTVHLWNLQSQNAVGYLNLHAPYFAAYDPSATVLAIASPPTRSILLYDIRMYDKPPFQTFDMQELEQQYMPQSTGNDWTKIQFSNDGKSLLVATTGQGHFVLDAFEGDLKHYCIRQGGHSGRKAPGQQFGASNVMGQGDCCFSPDGQYLIGGSGDEGMLVWDMEAPSTPNKVAEPKFSLPGPGRAAVVGYNHKVNLICSADKELLFWLPDPDAVG